MSKWPKRLLGFYEPRSRNIVQSTASLARSVCIAVLCTAFCISSAFGGTATLSWTPPTQNTDGSPLTNLAAYRLYWGCGSSGQYPESVLVPAPATGYVIEGLPDTGTCYFAATAINSNGAQSAFSAESSKTFTPAELPPSTPTIGPTITWSDEGGGGEGVGVVEQVSAHAAVGTSVTISGVKPGSALVVLMEHPSSASRVWSVADSVEGVWPVANSAQYDGPSGRDVYAAVRFDHAGGDVVVTCSSLSSNAGGYVVIEVSGVDEFDVAFTNAVNIANVTRSAPVGATVAAGSVSLFALVHNAASGSHVFTESGWIEIRDSNSLLAYRENAAAHVQSAESIWSTARAYGSVFFSLRPR
jgi:hypothetical protein